MTGANRTDVIGIEDTSLSVLPLERNGSSAIGGRLKRLFDVLAASAILLVLSPLFLFTTAAILLTSPGPVLFGHERIGLDGRRFRCWKFRTMCCDAERALRQHLTETPHARTEWEATRKLTHDPRITPLGHVLREYSVDELPQLLNVIRGDMSLVGPRPVVEDELTYYGSDVTRYLSARPGLTGLWQVSGRSDTAYDMRVELDVRYVRNWSFLFDLVILLRTIPAVVGARGSY